ncbi:uncharacterized protein LOC111542852 [Piliocolobus tephrosceles]|uniref:uncharacterized protein LOC111542852 n=1 Tax=Piliocolobus tephrosceles TaxID=591936 RepID=UPI000C2AF0E0|nr:uncharacterized protein LOC111542852 [Piliocolobus tephrosceles]
MDTSEIWCCDSERGTSLVRSIPCPLALCSMRKIHVRPGVLRPPSPRNISPILNQELINLAFKVYSNREEAARRQRISELQLLASAVRQNPAAPPAHKNFKMPKPHTPKPQQSSIPARLLPSGSCFKCQKSGHWVKECLQPGIPPKPCPICSRTHWKSDCPACLAATS